MKGEEVGNAVLALRFVLGWSHRVRMQAMHDA